MEERGLNGMQLAKETGLPKNAVSEWRSGKAKPGTDAVVKIADYFNVSTDFLLGRTHTDNENLCVVDGTCESFSVRTGELEKLLIIAECLLRNRFDFKRKFEFVMENDPGEPTTRFKLRYLNGHEAFLEKYDKMTDEEIVAAEKEDGFLDALGDALIYNFKKGSRMKLANP